MIIFDTDTCIELLRGNKRVIRKRSEYSGEVAICFMTVAELFYGAESSSRVKENRILVEKFILTVPVIQTDFRILKRFGELKAGLKKDDQLLPDADILIASATLEKAEALVTGNTKHFQRFSGINLKNWIR